MNLPKPQPESSEEFRLPGQQEPQPSSPVEQVAAPATNTEAPKAPLGGVIERDLADPNKLGNRPDPQQVQQQDEPVAQSAQPPAPLPDDSSAQPQTDATHTSSPTIADDVDVIEKEWVDKAKQIIDQTKDDPHRQEQEVEKLQQDYMLKRYGKQIKSPN